MDELERAVKKATRAKWRFFSFWTIATTQPMTLKGYELQDLRVYPVLKYENFEVKMHRNALLSRGNMRLVNN